MYFLGKSANAFYILIRMFCKSIKVSALKRYYTVVLLPICNPHVFAYLYLEHKLILFLACKALY